MTLKTLRNPGDGPLSPAELDWRAVLKQHERWLRTVVYARLGEPQAVEEVMQEVALVAIKQQAPLTNPAKVAPWLYRLAVRQVLLYRRKQGRQRKLNIRYAEKFQLLGQDTHTPDPLGWLLAEERRQLVRQALGNLQPKDAEILMLKYTENWSYKQLAEHLGTSHSAIESRLHRARARLRETLSAANVIEVSK